MRSLLRLALLVAAASLARFVGGGGGRQAAIWSMVRLAGVGEALRLAVLAKRALLIHLAVLGLLTESLMV